VITLSNDHCEVYLDAVEHHGGDAAESRIYASQLTILAEDPERIWAQIGEHAFYQVNTGHWGDPAIADWRSVESDRRGAPTSVVRFTNVHKTRRPPAGDGGRLAWSGPLSLVAGTGFEPATSGL
jgi:hypothetical protein